MSTVDLPSASASLLVRSAGSAAKTDWSRSHRHKRPSDRVHPRASEDHGRVPPRQGEEQRDQLHGTFDGRTGLSSAHHPRAAEGVHPTFIDHYINTASRKPVHGLVPSTYDIVRENHSQDARMLIVPSPSNTSVLAKRKNKYQGSARLIQCLNLPIANLPIQVNNGRLPSSTCCLLPLSLHHSLRSSSRF